MYSWGDDLSDWKNPSAYRYDKALRSRRDADARQASVNGPRSYARRRKPDWKLLDPRQKVSTESTTPIVIAVDITGSMAQWPFEIFDRLPLLYNTLSQYRPDLEIAFAAIGDVRVFDYPFQASAFGKGVELEAVLRGIYPEGLDKSSVDHPESYGLFPWWMNSRVSMPKAKDPPFVIVFGDITMHESHTPPEIEKVFGDPVQTDVDCIAEWRKTAQACNVWFLRSPRCVMKAETDRQWGKAVGGQKIVHIEDEQRAVDYAMGLIARSWGRFDDFKKNMAARQDQDKIKALEQQLAKK